MKFTRLVIIFNWKKLLQGSVVTVVCVVLACVLPWKPVAWALGIFGGLVFLNMVAALWASYWLYDASDLFQFKLWPKKYIHPHPQKAILVHASFDPLSAKVEAHYPQMKLAVYNIFGNRHEKDRGVSVANRVFPPHPNEITLDPTKLPDADHSTDVVFAVTAIHEIMTHEKRVGFFREAKRILKPSGQIILIEQMRTPINFLFFNIGAFHFLPVAEWDACVKESGLKITHKAHMTAFGSLWVLEKE